MANNDSSKPIVDFAAIKGNLGSEYKMVQVLDGSAKVVNQEVFDSFSDDQLVDFMKKMVWERALHEQTMSFSRQGRLGFYAPTAGEEASEMGSVSAFEPQDFLFPAYRDLPQLIQHGGSVEKGYLWSRGHVQGNIYDEKYRAWMPQIIIGAQYVEAAGAALGIKKNGEKNVAFVYTGDGGTSQGDTYEGLNFAGAFQAPLVAFVQNNGFAISVPREKQTAAKTLAQKAVAAGIPSVQVDGMDVLAVYSVAKAAREYAAAGNGPVLIETLTYRFGAHSSAGDDPSRYRTKEEEKPWHDLDPLIRMRKVLVDKGLWSDQQESEYVDQCKADFKAELKKADNEPKQTNIEELTNTFEVPTPNIKAQIAEFQAKESK
ncbi:pyruvate dehydrogenase (acetyl-transferring) E1 component subunit alpha [Furfurilactobacillus siliginis]|uniref:Pyruvate dehydrogenase E1 component subunit alpha n=1 Tax=Furfurilactobacillus siliginis TaxID=348151 RepID=A0A0R2L6M7_9LACO|nr:pyruvate dehydrogenase (acetyl-transferring) E1 component subunit alpha [Furfurilactobacillus siliginis]KRN94874.1 pyruvate dehydrogenase complex E1 component alpha subunit [Furfurilactobacillus siliginis]GEK28445.1 pyruvate dehydrogenase (acetyl-transferring) E1 component subunit alpha [Furfurilactobacillus siliginis]